MAEEVEATVEAGDQSTQEEAQQTVQPQSQQQQQQVKIPSGYVPVGEVAKERKKISEINSKLSAAEARAQEAEAKALRLEHQEAKRGIYRETIKTLGENFFIPRSEEVDSVIEAINYDAENPDNTKTIIAKVIEAAKRPVKTGPNTPMFGTTARDQNTPPKEDGKYALWERMQKRLKTNAS